MSWYSRVRKGAQGELIAAVDLMDKGYEVSRALSPGDSCDLIAHRFGTCLRVQVKTNQFSEIKPGKQELVAWVDLTTRTVRYDPYIIDYTGPCGFCRSPSHAFPECPEG